MRHRPHAEPLEARTLLAADPAMFDTTFGVGGKVRLDVDGLGDRADFVTPLPGGNLLVAGMATFAVTVNAPATDGQPASTTIEKQNREYVARLKPDGSLDSTFGEGGIVRFEYLSMPFLRPSLQPDGKMLFGSSSSIVFGNSGTAVGHDPALTLLRFNTDGKMDTGFGDQGVAKLNLFRSDDFRMPEDVTAIAVQPDGKIVVAATVYEPDGPPRPPEQAGTRKLFGAVARFNADGTPDDTFARHVEDLGFYPSSALIDAEGRVVVGGAPGGSSLSGATGGFGLARFNGDGSFDASFGQGGKAFVPLPAAADNTDLAQMADLLLQPDGKLVAAGRIGIRHYGLVRFNSNGTPDASFDGDGVVLGRGTQGGTYGHQGGQYRLRYDPADGGTVQLAGIGNGYSETPNPNTDPAQPPTIKTPTGLQVFTARFASDGRLLSSGRAENQPMAAVESVNGVAIQDDGRIVGVGQAFPTADAGEGASYYETADALVVRFDPATLPADTSALTFAGVVPTTPPAPITAPDGYTFAPGNDSGPELYDGSSRLHGVTLNALQGTTSVPVTFSGRTAVRGGRAYTFRINYPSEALARQTPVTVTGPNNFNGPAQPLRVKPTGPRRVAAGATRPAVATYRLAAPGGTFDVTDNGAYLVRLGPPPAQPAGGRVVGVFTVNSRAGARRAPGGAASSAFRRIVVPDIPTANGQPALTGVLHRTTLAGTNETSWTIQRADAPSGVVDLDVSAAPAAIGILADKKVQVVGTVTYESRPGRGLVLVFHVASIALAP